MFGISTFAQSPFAALGGNAYPVDVAESFTLSDVYDGPVAFGGEWADSFALADSDGGGSTFDFFGAIEDNFSWNDEAFGVYDVLVAQAESFSLVDEVVTYQVGIYVSSGTFYLNDYSTNQSQLIAMEIA